MARYIKAKILNFLRKCVPVEEIKTKLEYGTYEKDVLGFITMCPKGGQVFIMDLTTNRVIDNERTSPMYMDNIHHPYFFEFALEKAYRSGATRIIVDAGNGVSQKYCEDEIKRLRIPGCPIEVRHDFFPRTNRILKRKD